MQDNNLSIDEPQQHLGPDVAELNSTPIKLFNLSLDSSSSSHRQNNTNHTTASSSSSKLGANTSKKKTKASLKKSLLNSSVKSEKCTHMAAAAAAAASSTSNPNSCSSTSGNQIKPEANNFNYEASSQCSRRLSGRNLMNHLNDEHMDTVDSTINKQRSANG